MDDLLATAVRKLRVMLIARSEGGARWAVVDTTGYDVPEVWVFDTKEAAVDFITAYRPLEGHGVWITQTSSIGGAR